MAAYIGPLTGAQQPCETQAVEAVLAPAYDPKRLYGQETGCKGRRCNPFASYNPKCIRPDEDIRFADLGEHCNHLMRAHP